VGDAWWAWQKAKGCPDDPKLIKFSEVVLAAMEVMGHTWPGRKPLLKFSGNRMCALFANGWTAAQARQAILLDPQVANLNTGSYGPLPREVFDRTVALRQRLAEEPMDFLVRMYPPLLWQARTQLAAFLGAEPRRLIFTANVSTSINIVASGLTLSRPGEILLTDHEYGAMHWCWERAAQRQGLTLRTFPLPILAEDPAEIIDAFTHALGERTRLLFFSHVVSATGMVLPVREICAEARRRGILTMVDGAHAPAMVPLQLDDLACDFYGGNCHKWLLAPTGSGFLYLGRGSEDRLQPLQVSWGYQPNRQGYDACDEFGTTPRLRFYEFEGTRDPCPWLAVPHAIDFQHRLGLDRIRAHNATLVDHVRQRLARFPSLQRITPLHSHLHGFLTAYRLPRNVNIPRWRKVLWEKYRIEAPLFERPEGWLLRVSTHFYNTPEEIDRLALALEELTGAE
jgi:isopenicillin-N epimerase